MPLLPKSAVHDARADAALERLVFFSDAVFAIAITLLVIGICVPDLPRGSSDADYLRALRVLIPSLAGYFISFAIVATFWVTHQRAFALARHYSGRVLLWNMLLLGMIAFVPFASAFVSLNFGDRVPTLAYCAVIALCGLLNCAVVWIATAPPIVAQNATALDREAIRLRSLSLVLGALTAAAVGYLQPKWGLAAFASVRLWLRLGDWVTRRWPTSI